MNPMMTIAPELTETLTGEPQIAPAVRQRLEVWLSVYNDLKEQIALLEAQADAEKAAMGTLLEDAGIDKANIDGQPLAWIRDAKNPGRLDKVKLMAQGATQKQIDAATVGGGTKKPYLQIRAKNGQNEGLD